jgi:hypothetical protein
MAGCEKSYPPCQVAERGICFVGVSSFVLAPACAFEDRSNGRINTLELTPATTFERVWSFTEVSRDIAFDQTAIAGIYIFRHSRHLSHLLGLVLLT